MRSKKEDKQLFCPSVKKIDWLLTRVKKVDRVFVFLECHEDRHEFVCTSVDMNLHCISVQKTNEFALPKKVDTGLVCMKDKRIGQITGGPF